MKKSIFLFCALSLSFSFFLSSSALAQGTQQQQKRGMMGMHCIAPWKMMKFMKDLNITDEQKTALKALKAETDNQTAALPTQIAALQEQMDETFLAPEIDTATAESQIDQMLTLQSQLTDSILHAQLKAVQILTADQRAIMLDLTTQLRTCAQSQHGVKSLDKQQAYVSLLIAE